MQTTLKNFISRYHPRSIRSLVYMAQQSEYHPREFLKWLWRTGDFLRVEQRKTLVKTPKALLFLAALYLFAILWFAFTLWVLLVGVVWWKYLVFLLILAPIQDTTMLLITLGILFALNHTYSFIKNSVEDGYMSAKAEKEYYHIIEETADGLGRNPRRSVRWLERLIVHFDTTPEIQHQRQIERGDSLEKVIPIKYLTALNKLNENYVFATDSAYNDRGELLPKSERIDVYKEFNLIPPAVMRLPSGVHFGDSP
ncbi:MAG: hypothetical protein UY50_C0023G0050, partial [Parcubacteria group bacterium GW2011_GWA2_49_9]